MHVRRSQSLLGAQRSAINLSRRASKQHFIRNSAVLSSAVYPYPPRLDSRRSSSAKQLISMDYSLADDPDDPTPALTRYLTQEQRKGRRIVNENEVLQHLDHTEARHRAAARNAVNTFNERHGRGLHGDILLLSGVWIPIDSLKSHHASLKKHRADACFARIPVQAYTKFCSE